MTFLSFFNKATDVLSRSIPSTSRSSARQGSSCKASSRAQRSSEINKDLSCHNTSVADEHQPLEQALSSRSDGATTFDEWLSSRATPSSFRRACPETHVAHSNERSGRSVDGGRPSPTTPRAPSRASSEPAPSRYAALEVALDLFDLNARFERETLLRPREVAQCQRQTQAESKPELISGPRPTERYKAVEGMLLFLDAQAEHRCA